MIRLIDAGKRFGPKILFEGVEWLITPQDRVALVGANGTGKSTLLKILAGIEDLESGQREVARGTTIGYLPQQGLELKGRPLFEECLSVFAHIREIEKEMERLMARMSFLDPAAQEYDQVAERFHRLEDEFRARDGYRIEAETGAVLMGLGFRREDWKRLTDEFSGGWQMRIALAKLLLAKPNLLLLDEPTNHLDIEAREWLESYLGEYPNAFLLVSHDRYFLDVTVRKIVELWNDNLHIYHGNYSEYERLKEERLTQLEAAQKNQQRHIDHLESFINRFRYKASKAKQAQSRIKELNKIERIELPEQSETIHFRFPQPPPSGRIVVEAKGLAKSYGRKHVFSGADFVIERGDRIALVGVNGAGKSTLMKILSGQEPPTAGEVRLGHNVEVEYFAQDQYKELNPKAKLFDDLVEIAPRATNTELRSLLGCFLFSAEDVFKTIEVLSGGERNRYAIARMLLQPANLLLMDEPTNHLDLQAKEVLLGALADFSGTVVFVSHDRYFLEQLATRVLEVAAGAVTDYRLTYEEYLRHKAERAAAAAQAVPEPPTNGAAAASPASGSKRVNPMKLRQLESRRDQIEQEVERLEAHLEEWRSEMANFRNAEESQRLSHLEADGRQRLESLMEEWETLSLEIESATAVT